MSSSSSLFSEEILEWLKTGPYKGLTVGMTRADCMERMGLLEDELASGVWPIELKFEENPVALLHNSRLELIDTEEFGNCTDPHVTIDDISAHRETVRLEKVICLLSRMDIPFKISKATFKKSDADCIRIETQHKVDLIFYTDHIKERCLLESMQQYSEGYRTYFLTDDLYPPNQSDV